MLRRNILIFHNAALGDFAVTWPLAMTAGRLFPQARVIYITAGGKGKLAEHVLRVESLDIESGFAGLWADAADVSTTARRVLDGAAMIFSFVSAAGDAWARTVAALAPEARLVHLSTKLPDSYDAHVSRYIAQQLANDFPGVAAGMVSMIDSLSRRAFSARSASRTGVLIHPGSGAERKNWARSNFVALCENLARVLKHVRLKVVLGEVELEKWGASCRDEFAKFAEVIAPSSLIDLQHAIDEAAVVVCNDSGPAHLAGISGAPTIALFGRSSNAVRWRPLGPNVHVIEAASLDEISVEQVRQKIIALLASAQSGAAQSAPAPTEDE
jgi:ADP-heptose:LPS heptosyltransferase